VTKLLQCLRDESCVATTLLRPSEATSRSLTRSASIRVRASIESRPPSSDATTCSSSRSAGWRSGQWSRRSVRCVSSVGMSCTVVMCVRTYRSVASVACIWQGSTDSLRFPTSARRGSVVRPTVGSPWTSRESTRGNRVARPLARGDVGSSTSGTGESPPVPRNDGLRLNDVDGQAPTTPCVREPRP
jgi:hypothetical protein